MTTAIGFGCESTTKAPPSTQTDATVESEETPQRRETAVPGVFTVAVINATDSPAPEWVVDTARSMLAKHGYPISDPAGSEILVICRTEHMSLYETPPAGESHLEIKTSG